MAQMAQKGLGEMGIHLKRLDFTSTVGALLCCAARHAVTADGATHQALDEIAVSLNNVAAIVGRHGLAGRLNGPIPAVPTVAGLGDEWEEGEPDGEDLGDLQIEIPPAMKREEGRLTPKALLVLDYIRANAGCSTEEIVLACGITSASLNTNVTTLRRAGFVVGVKRGGRGGPSTYRIED